MSISVVIVSWNARSFLLNCLTSVLAQRVAEPLDVIVVDNASTDGSAQAVREAFQTVRLICNPDNFGFAKANNIGIRASVGEYLFLINSDVIVAAGCLQEMIDHMEQHAEIGVLGPKIIDAAGHYQRSCMGYPTLWNTFCRALALDGLFPRSQVFGGQLLPFWRHDETCPVDVINGCFWLIRRSAMEQVGLLDERFFIYGEDVDWCKRFNEKQWTVVFKADVEAIHYGGASSANAPVRFYLEKQRANYFYWLKHRSRAATVAFLMITLLHDSVRVTGAAARYLFAQGSRQDASYKMARSLASIRWILGDTRHLPGQPREIEARVG